jgi:hypothetical protein
MIIGSLLGGFTGTYINNKIEQKWKILSPFEILEFLENSIDNQGLWLDYQHVCYKIKLDYCNILKNLPKNFEKCYGIFSDVLLWINFIVLNIITFIANNCQENRCKILFEKSYIFLKTSQNSRVKYYKYLDNLQDILDKWILNL